MNKYFHEIPQEEIESLIAGDKTWGDISSQFKQPDWCDYPEALNGDMGCYSLTDIRRGGLREKISIDFCSTCDCFKKEKAPQ